MSVRLASDFNYCQPVGLPAAADGSGLASGMRADGRNSKDRETSMIKEYLDTIKAMNAFGGIADNPVYRHELPDSRG